MAATLALGIGSTNTLCWAQSDEIRAGARAAATEGAKAFREHRFADAVDLFSRAESLVHAPPHLLYLARSLAALGQLVRAQEAYLKITRDRIEAGAPKAFQDAQADANKELPALEARIPSVKATIQGGGANAVTLTMDGTPVPAALVGVPRPVDPGEHKFQAAGEGLTSDVVSLTVKEGARESVVLALKPSGVASAARTTTEPVPATPAVAAAGMAPSGGAIAPSSAASADQATDTGGKTNGLRIGSYVAFGVGAAGLALGTVFLLKSKSKTSEGDDLYRQYCPGPGCIAHQPQIQGFDSDASSARTMGAANFIVGGVGIATGVTLLVLSMKQDGSAAQARPSVSPWVGLGSAGVAGVF